MKYFFLKIACFLLLSTLTVFAQPIVRLKFRYMPQAQYTRVHFPGNYNVNQADNWGPNTNGTILEGTPSQADSLETSTGLWVKTVSLYPGTYQYKIYRQLSPTPTNWSWILDPVNRLVFTETSGNQNSQVTIDNLVLFEPCAYPYFIETGAAGTKFVCQTSVPKLSVGIFQPSGRPQVTITATIDNVPIANSLSYLDAVSGIFTYQPAGLTDGMHTFGLSVTDGSLTKKDSVIFEVRARLVQIQTPPFTTRKAVYITSGIVMKPDGSGLDTMLTSIEVSVNGTSKSVPVTMGSFFDSTALTEGQNWISASTPLGRDSVLVTRVVNHTPWATATAQLSGNSVTLDASASTDPDLQILTNFKWLDDAAYSLGLNGQAGATASVTKPDLAGEYYYGLIATDLDGHADTTRTYFIVNGDGSVSNPTIANNPEWAKQGRIYFLFPKAASSAGTINAAAPRLSIIKDMGFNIIWMMPVMDNNDLINQQSGPGYNIVDFYNVAPEYGTNQDFKNFISQAHALGLRVILDVTPNHTSYKHLWSADAHTNKQKSPYWNWYEHNNQPYSQTNTLGSSLDGDGFNYYSGFSDQLLNYNWTDVDAQAEMINVYKYWIKEFGLDGYRFDVYWGPHRRYGEQYMGGPVRDALKHIKPDIFLLGEDDGTGSGTETIYADYSSGGINGGVDAAYDFKLFFNQIRGFGFNGSAVNNLHGDILNGGYYPGPHSLYMRFMESQDEDRIAYAYSASGTLDATTTFMKTMPIASTIFTVPGIPMIWNGQEVGKGYGDNNFDSRRRGTIDWNFSGKGLLTPHYQKLAQIRGQFKAFSTQQIIRLSSSDPLVYAFSRPYTREDGIVAVNFGAAPSNVTISFSVSDLSGWVQESKTYIISDLYNNTTYPVTIVGGSTTLNLTMPAYGTAICVLADSAKHAVIPVNVASDRSELLPAKTQLFQNYPNPFNPSTTFHFDLLQQEHVQIRIFNILGKEIGEVVNNSFSAGTHQVLWDGKTSSGIVASSGVYFVRFEAGSFVETKKIVLMK